MKLLVLFLLLLSTVYSYTLVPLSTCSAQNAPTYHVGKSSRIFIVSTGAQDTLGNLGVFVGAQVTTGYQLSIPGPTGSLTPLIPAEDNDVLKFVQNGAKNSTGYLYITEDPKINVYPLFSQKLHFQPGTNLYFALDIEAFKDPIADNVVISETVLLRGYAGVPEENGSLFFDSASINGLTTYTQLQLPMPIFHFKSNGVDVQYDLYYGTEGLLSTNYSGLRMSDNFPQFLYTASSMGAGNHNNDNLTLTMVFHFNPTINYTVLVSLEGDNMTPIYFHMESSEYGIVQSTSPFNTISISAGGPYSTQFQIQNTDPKPTTMVPSTTSLIASTVTQSTVVTTTKGAEGARGIFLAFLILLIIL